MTTSYSWKTSHNTQTYHNYSLHRLDNGESSFPSTAGSKCSALLWGHSAHVQSILKDRLRTEPNTGAIV